VRTAPTLTAIAPLAPQQIVGDAGHTIYQVHDRTLRQTAVAAALVARADGASRTLGYASTLAGAIGGGWMATLLGARAGLTVAASVLALAAMVTGIRLARAQPASCRASMPEVDSDTRAAAVGFRPPSHYVAGCAAGRGISIDST